MEAQGSCNIKNEFSYSHSRETIFKFCKRAYFFNYYASWGGWLEEADKQTRHIYRLKQIKTADNWIDSIVISSIARALKKEIPTDISSIKNSAYKHLFSDLLSIQAKEYLKEPKRPLIFEVYYGLESLSYLKESAEKRVNSIFHNLDCSEIHNLLRKKYLDFISVNQVSSFLLAGIKVWHYSDLVYHDDDRIILENIRFRNFRSDHSWHINSSLSLIDGLKSLLKFNKTLTPRTKFIYDNRILNVYAFAEPSELIRNIIDSSALMLSHLNKSSEAVSENFPKCNEENKCRVCKFKEACSSVF